MSKSTSDSAVAQDPSLALTRALIRRRSVTPEDAGCQALIGDRLASLDFHIESMRFGETDNLWARHGHEGPVLCFAGHTDVVPAGDLDRWTTDPFDPVVKDGMLHGRGAADMKSGLAAMVIAAERFVSAYPNHAGSLAILLTSDEEGKARDGTKRVIETLSERGEKIDWCLVGEPSSETMLGDLIRIGRRGSLSGQLEIHGTQGHVAYPQLADNPIRRFALLASELCETRWDEGNEFFPPTSFQFVNVEAGAGAPNVTPGSLTARFNFRYCNQWQHKELRTAVEKILNRHQLDYTLDWHLSGEPFLTERTTLIDAVVGSLKTHVGRAPELSTGGGTSDGRFISPSGAEVVELGPVNASIHKVNEHVRVEDIATLAKIYEDVANRLLTE